MQSTKLIQGFYKRGFTFAHLLMYKQVLQEILKLHEADPENFFDSLVTKGETWVPHFDPESKTESCQWKYQAHQL